MSTRLRSVVSRNKRRLVKDDFNLDLSYITSQIIAMGYPSHGVRALYRNPYHQVKRFMDSNHSGKYRIYNLCAEPSFQYDASLFENRLACFPFLDHSPPPFSLIPSWCSDLESWLSNNNDHIAAIHCKAGKGRTGLCICTFLLHSNIVSSADDAITYFGTRRTSDGKGLTIPSQQRYVFYYQDYLKVSRLGVPIDFERYQSVLLTGLSINQCPNLQDGGRLSYDVIDVDNQVIFDSTSRSTTWSSPNQPVDLPPCPVQLKGDFQIKLYHVKPLGRRVKLARICLNSMFLPKDGSIVLKKSEIDHVHKDTGHHVFSKDIEITLSFFSTDYNLSIFNEISRISKVIEEDDESTKEENEIYQFVNDLIDDVIDDVIHQPMNIEELVNVVEEDFGLVNIWMCSDSNSSTESDWQSESESELIDSTPQPQHPQKASSDFDIPLDPRSQPSSSKESPFSRTELLPEPAEVMAEGRERLEGHEKFLEQMIGQLDSELDVEVL
ncbi:hypothetical protein P9112_001920 [Eukaryota sp. TZLM1-RC]